MLELEKVEGLVDNAVIFASYVRKTITNLLLTKITKNENQTCFFVENVIKDCLVIRKIDNKNLTLIKPVKDVQKKQSEG
jgi:hypothetical protein